MTNSDQNMKDSTAKFYKKIKETWNKLSDDNIKLYEGQRDQFFAKLKELHNVSKEDAQKKLEQLEKDCGCSGMSKAA